MAINKMSSDQVSPRQGDGQSQRTKPNQSSRDDSFRKTYEKDRSLRDDGEEVVVENEKEETPPPSLFDLSKKSGPRKTPPPAAASPVKTESPLLGAAEDLPLPLHETSPNPAVEPFGDKKGSLPHPPPATEQGRPPAKGYSPQTNRTDLPRAPEKMPLPMTDPLTQIDEKGQLPAATKDAEAPLPATPKKAPAPLQGNLKEPGTTQEAEALLSKTRLSSDLKKEQELASLQTEDKPIAATAEPKEVKPVSKRDKNKGESRLPGTDLGEGRPDPSLLQSGIQAALFQTEKSPQSQDMTPSSVIKDIAAQIVDQIQTMRQGDQTSTMVTLRHPPLLEGATITLTASDHAKREFNVSFANLSPDAKLMLDRKLTEDSLTQTLERKGIVVHIVTTSTQPEPSFEVTSGQAASDQQQRQQQEQQRQQQQKRQPFQQEEESE